ncbi:MAG: hypothetical protein Kilf2KO_05100 [Rhodospirillales bacterium]
MIARRIPAEWWRFLAVSIVGLVVDLGTALFLRSLGVNLFVAASLGFAVAVFVNFHLHGRWTFAGRTDTSARRLIKFYVTSLITILVRLAALKLLMLMSLPVLFYRDAELLVLATGVSLVANFLLSKYLVFRA